MMCPVGLLYPNALSLAGETSPASVLEIISSSFCNLMIFLVIFMDTDIMALVQFTACIVLTEVQTAVGRWQACDNHLCC